MKNAPLTAHKILGITAGLLGIEHGIYEVLQGPDSPGGLLIRAMGTPCVAEEAWHSCLPAMTVWPTFRWAGISAILISVVLIITSLVNIKRKIPFLCLLAVLLFISGGGFIAFFYTTLAVVAILLDKKGHASRKSELNAFLAALWPGVLIAFLACTLGVMLLGHFNNDLVLRFSAIIFLVSDFVLPVLVVVSSRSRQL